MSCSWESVLRTKISGRLKLLCGKDVTTCIYYVFSRPNTGICDGDRQMMGLLFLPSLHQTERRACVCPLLETSIPFGTLRVSRHRRWISNWFPLPLSLLQLLRMMLTQAPLPEMRLMFGSVLSATPVREIWTWLVVTPVMNGFISCAWE